MALDVETAKAFLREATDAETENRQLGLQALQFRYGDQWPEYAIASRGLERPKLTINETNAMIRRITNAQRQQRPRGKASPVDDFADKKVAKIITGIGRHVEVNSDADYAYDTAFDSAATVGWGFIRMRTDFISEDSFNQDIFIDGVDNPFNVYFDYNSRLPDGSDGEKALITELMSKELFKKKYPSAQDSGFSDRGTGDSDPDWVTSRDIRLAEYFYVDRDRAKLVMLSDGTALYEDQLPPKELMMAAGVGIIGDRDSFKRAVKWCKQTGFEILEEKKLPGRWIPVVPVYWTNVVIDFRRVKRGLVYDAMDPARMNNFWLTAMTESLALAPKAKWLLAEGQDEGHENDFKNANLAANPVLRYKQTDVNGKDAPPPQRLQPEPPPAGLIQAAMMASQSLSKVLGVVDPATRQGAQHKGADTLQAERGQFENTNYDGYDNLTRSIKHVWRIMLSWIPTTYDTQRVQRIIGEDGREQMVTLNEKTVARHPETGEAIQKVLNDVCTGTYDVVMETGPGYDTKRQEGAHALIELMGTPLGEKIATQADDLVVRSMDFNGADLIADRLAAGNPLAQVDEKSEIPPAVQMKIKGLEQVIQQQQGQLQQAGIEIKFGLKKEEMKQEGETKRALMANIAKAHDTNERNLSMQHSTEVKALTAQNVEEIRGLVKILSDKLGSAHDLNIFEREVAARDREQERKAAEIASQPLQ